MKDDEQDQLWELLGKAREPKASPFFANKVMHAIRRESEPEPARATLGSWIRRWWFVPVTAGACAAVAAVTLLRESVPPTPAPQVAKVDPLTEMVVVISDTNEFETSLSDLVATEDNSVWLAADPSSLF
jgi:hypothetical protein